MDKARGFTIVELLVAIVIIGILGTLALVSYSTILSRTYISAVKSDLSANDKKAKSYLAKYGSFPTQLDAKNCPSAPTADSNFCFQNSSQTTILSYTGSSTAYTLTMGPPSSNPNNPIFVVTPSISPTQLVTFAVRLNNGGVDSPNNIIKTTDGGVAVSGIVNAYYSPTGDPPPCSASSCQGTGSALIAKFNSSGSLSFARGWNGSSQEDELKTVVQTSDGGYIAAGTAHTAGISDNDGLLVKYNADGSKAWDKLIGNTTSDNAYSVVEAKSPESGFVVSGKVSSVGYVAKFSTSGSLDWYTSLTGISVDTALANTSDGGYVLAGNNFLIKLNSLGAVSWSKSWSNTTNLSYTQSVQQTSDGGYIYAGSTNSYGSGGNDAYLIKFDSGGNFSWARTWGGTGNEYGYSVIQTIDGGYAIAGSNSNNDAFFAKFDSTGNLTWSREFGLQSGGGEVATSIVQMSDGGYAITGDTYSYQAEGDIFIARYDNYGSMTSCDTTLCRTITGTTTSPTITINTTSITTGSTSPNIVAGGISLDSLTPTIIQMAF